jgi:hypothetical protein
MLGGVKRDDANRVAVTRAIRSDSMSFIQLLREKRAKAPVVAEDAWRLRLERVRGKIGGDGIERISTQALLDHLEVSQSVRSTGACRRLAKLMRELGWAPTKAKGLTQGGFREQVRGYARDKRGSVLF